MNRLVASEAEANRHGHGREVVHSSDLPNDDVSVLLLLGERVKSERRRMERETLFIVGDGGVRRRWWRCCRELIMVCNERLEYGSALSH
jgi:hypothetical protein